MEHSNEFRRFEDDLISDERWAQRDAVLAEIGAPLLLAPIEGTLSSLREALRTRFADVNRRILDAANEHIKIRGRGEKRRWSLIYPTAKERRTAPFTASFRAPASPTCCGSLPGAPDFSTASPMCSSAT